MKLIGLMLTRNEEHVLPYTLPALEKICDHIIIADQQSTDGTRDIIKKSPKTILIDNPPSPPDGNYDTQGRQLLLNRAREFDGHNLLLCLDADELAPPALFRNFKDYVAEHYKPSTRIRMRSIQLWQSDRMYRPAPIFPRYFGIWGSVVLYDDRSCDYSEPKSWIHSGRTPRTRYKKYVHSPVILHLHWLFWEKALWQQIWYQMQEFILADFNKDEVRRIDNYYYDLAFDGATIKTEKLPTSWQTGTTIKPPPPESYQWRKNAIMALIKKYGVQRFEPLNIWYVPKLKQLFQEECQRDPIPSPLHYSARDKWRFYKNHMGLLTKELRHKIHPQGPRSMG